MTGGGPATPAQYPAMIRPTLRRRGGRSMPVPFSGGLRLRRDPLYLLQGAFRLLRLSLHGMPEADGRGPSARRSRCRSRGSPSTGASPGSDGGSPTAATRSTSASAAIAALRSSPAGPARPHVRVIFAGTLDDPSWVPIKANIWTRSALPWVHLDPDIERFEMLPDFAKYFENR